MKLAELRSLDKGTVLSWSQGGGWYQDVEFLGLTKTTSFGKMTFSDLMSGKFNPSNGKTQLMVHIKYTDDRGKEVDRYVNPRSLRKK